MSVVEVVPKASDRVMNSLASGASEVGIGSWSLNSLM